MINHSSQAYQALIALYENRHIILKTLIKEPNNENLLEQLKSSESELSTLHEDYMRELDSNRVGVLA